MKKAELVFCLKYGDLIIKKDDKIVYIVDSQVKHGTVVSLGINTLDKEYPSMMWVLLEEKDGKYVCDLVDLRSIAYIALDQ